MSHIDFNISYIIESLEFLSHNSTDCALLKGYLHNPKLRFPFQLFISHEGQGKWKYEKLILSAHKLNSKTKKQFQSSDFKSQLVSKVSTVLTTINMWYGEQSKQGGKSNLNQFYPPEDAIDKVSVSFRSNVLDIPNTSWDRLWELIKLRANNDEFFWVQGFSQEELFESIEELEQIFPASWIKKQFKDDETGEYHSLNFELPQESKFWYPSYHIARTSIGAICVDPAWNYLIELSNAIKELKSFPKLKSIKNSLTKQAGNQHHLCYANEFKKRKMLVELEPLIGNGPAKNDLLIKFNDQLIDIELKAFTSQSPENRIKKEISKKINQLPKNVARPLIFHLVLIENEGYNRTQELNFFESVRRIDSELLGDIHAVVAGRMFVDSTGGHLKRDIQAVNINSLSKFSISQEEIEEIFKPNYSEIIYPIYGIGSFIEFGKSK